MKELVTGSFDEEVQEIRTWWEVKVSYLDPVTNRPVCDMSIKRSPEEKFVPLIKELTDISQLENSTGKVIYHLGHYFWVIPNNTTYGDYIIY